MIANQLPVRDITLAPDWAYRSLAEPETMRRKLESYPVRNYPRTQNPKAAADWLKNLAIPAPKCDRTLREHIEGTLRRLRTASGNYRKRCRQDIHRMLTHLAELHTAQRLAATTS